MKNSGRKPGSHSRNSNCSLRTIPYRPLFSGVCPEPRADRGWASADLRDAGSLWQAASGSLVWGVLSPLPATDTNRWCQTAACCASGCMWKQTRSSIHHPFLLFGAMTGLFLLIEGIVSLPQSQDCSPGKEGAPRHTTYFKKTNLAMMS